MIVEVVLLSLPLLVKECFSEFVGLLERALAKVVIGFGWRAHLLSNFAVAENSAFLMVSVALPPRGLALPREMA